MNSYRYSTLLFWIVFCFGFSHRIEAVEKIIGDFEKNLAGWSFSNGGEFPGAAGSLERSNKAAFAGNYGAQLNFDFRKGGAYVAMYYRFPKPVHLQYLRFKLHKPPEAKFTVRLTDSTGQTLQKSCHYKHGDWQQIQVGLQGWSGHWGGADDGQVHQKVQAIGILVEKQGLLDPKGNIYIDEVAAVTGDKKTGKQDAVETEYLVADLEKPLAPSTSLLGKPGALRIFVKTDGSAGKLRILCSSHFQSFEKIVDLPRKDGFQVIEVGVPPMGWRYFGGENDGLLHGPIRVIGVELVGSAKEHATLKELRVRTVVTPRTAYAVFPLCKASNKEALFNFKLKKLLSSGINIKSEGFITNWEGVPIKFAGSANIFKHPFGEHNFLRAVFCSYPMETKGIPLDFAGTQLQTITIGAVRPISSPGDKKLDPASPWGVGLYLYRYPGNKKGFALMERAAGMARDAGVKWSREEFQWNRIEPEEGRFQWDFYDHMVDTARRNGIQVYGILAYWSRWAPAYTEKGIAAYAHWAAATVKRYHDRIHHWEIWNEPNIFFWPGPPGMYAQLLKKSYRAIKNADPGAKVLGLSTAGIDIRFIKRMLELKAPFDILTIHPYRGSLNDSGFMKELREVKALAGNRPVWITEMGWPTQIGGRSESDQARLLARSYLSAVCSGAIDNMGWYDFREDGFDPLYNEHHFGVIRRDMQPKAAYLALAAVCRTIGNKPLLDSISNEKGLFAFRFGGGTENITALWSPHKTRIVNISTGAKQITIRNTVGEDHLLKTENGNGLVVLPADSPVYILSDKQLTSCKSILFIDPAGAARSGKPLRLSWHVADRLAHPIELLQYRTTGSSHHFTKKLSAGPGPCKGEFDVIIPGAPKPADVFIEVKSGSWRNWFPISIDLQVELLRF